jgi:hypothetical protein
MTRVSVSLCKIMASLSVNSEVNYVRKKENIKECRRYRINLFLFKLDIKL